MRPPKGSWYHFTKFIQNTGVRDPIILYLPKTKGEKRIVLGLLALSGIIIFALSVFYFLNPRNIVGDALVNNATANPLEVPPPGSFFIYVKPVTVLFACLVVFSFCGFSLFGVVVNKIPRGLRAILLIVSVLSLAVSVYEVLFNFTLWGALLARSQSSPDSVVNSYPISSYRINLAFATKSFVALAFISLFAVLTFRNSLESSNS